MAMDHIDIERAFAQDTSELADWNIPLSFMKSRHLEAIEGMEADGSSWRIKDRMKTVAVIITYCLNIGVDPPDVVKTDPCARLECWIDPLSIGPQKALEQIGVSLEKQYQRWQPRARYKQLLDPTLEDIKKNCVAHRRNAKNDRVLFHYNGHGVPKPTLNGEIWVFNKSYTQYIPLSLYDLQCWLSFPTIYVFDCSLAGVVVERFKHFASQKEQEFLLQNSVDPNGLAGAENLGLLNHSIILAACSSEEMLPMNPILPADLFTVCLTSPIATALRWVCWRKIGKLVGKITVDMVDRLPGRVTDRKTPLGELNWIFTAVTDTIAWNTFPRDVFKQLYRQDLLVASLFRNFLLAQRILRSYSCTPVSHPELPTTHQHPLWDAWDMAVDHCLAQLPGLLEGKEYQPNPFLLHQMKAFQVWLVTGSPGKRPPEQLPIVLQVLLSQVYRFQALELLGRFLDLGPWAVHLALSVGIFPYVLKLLQSKNRELQNILVFIWAKILAVDGSCQVDLSKEKNHEYFVAILKDTTTQYEYRTMAAFVLAVIVNGNSRGQNVCLQSNLISICLEQLDEPNPLLRQWLALCLGCLWRNNEEAQWRGVRDSAHEKLYKLLWDEVPDVRASGVFALGTFINSSTDGTNDMAVSINRSIGVNLLALYQDPSPLARKEVVAALCRLVMYHKHQFEIVSLQAVDAFSAPSIKTSITAQGWVKVDLEDKSSSHRERAYGFSGNLHRKRTDSDSSTDDLHSSSEGLLDSLPKKGPGTVTHTHAHHVNNSFYTNVWKGLLNLSRDPCPDVAAFAKKGVSAVKDSVKEPDPPAVVINKAASFSAPSSPMKHSFKRILTTKTQTATPLMLSTSHTPRHSEPLLSPPQVPVKRGTVDKEQESSEGSEGEDQPDAPTGLEACIETSFFKWCCKYFAHPIIKVQRTGDADPYGEGYFQREYRFLRNEQWRQNAQKICMKAGKIKYGDQMFVNRITQKPQVLKFHPYYPNLTVATKTLISVWDIETGTDICTFDNHAEGEKVTALEYINPHDLTYLMTGTDKGIVRVWRDWMTPDSTPRLVTAWKALSDTLPVNKSAGLVLNWDQMNGVLHASGDVTLIRLWDTHKEMKIVDIPTNADTNVTCMVTDPHTYSTIVAGCGDGSVRVYDKRMAPQSCMVQSFKEHTGFVVSIHAQHYGKRLIMSSCNNGDVRLWDIRAAQMVSTLPTVPSLYICDAQPHAPLLACCASNTQSIKIYNVDTLQPAQSIQYHTGFIGQKIGLTKCLAFHPHHLWLAAGSNDALISVYTWEKKR
jgi:regulator-associated protein of mTOR